MMIRFEDTAAVYELLRDNGEVLGAFDTFAEAMEDKAQREREGEPA